MLEGELGVPFYRRSEAVSVNGVLRRWITAAQCSVGEFMRLGINVEVHWFHSDAKRTWMRSLGWVPTERGGAGPSAAESVRSACRATATVQRGVLACMRPRGATRRIGRRRTALSRRSALCRPLRWFGRRKTRRRRRARVPPTPGRRQARVWSSGQAGQAASNVPKALWPRD